MLRTHLIHPEILAALASAGHGSQVLISDGNFPHATATPPGARLAFLNATPRSRGRSRRSGSPAASTPTTG